MKPEITKLFLEAADKPTKFEQISLQFEDYLFRNLKTLKDHLSPCNFEIAFEKFWEGSLNIVRNLIQYGLNVSFRNI